MTHHQNTADVVEAIAKEAGFLSPGDRLLTEGILPFARGPFSFAARRDASLVRLLAQAGFPAAVHVLAVDRDPYELTDVTVTVDFGPATYALSLNRETTVHAIEAPSAD